MKTVIVGGGAIGRLFGYFLVKGGNEITLIAIDPKTVGALQEKAIGLIADDHRQPDEAQSFPVRALNSADSLTETDLVLLLVKSQATHQTMVELIKLLECWKPGVEQQ